MREHRCELCGKPLAGGLDTFGDPSCELCWDCFGETNAQPPHRQEGSALPSRPGGEAALGHSLGFWPDLWPG
jgi:hypothetical protein